MKIALIGYGKMGKAVEAQARAKGHEIVLRVTGDNLSELTPEKIKLADVAIEFSQPDAAVKNISFCLENGIPVVSGTTGWLEEMEYVKSLCKKHQGTFFYASNFSIGVNILFALNCYLANLMKNQPGYDVSIEEAHHVQKLDYPSGTAITLAQGIIERSEKIKWAGRLNDENIEGDELGEDSALIIKSMRVGQVPGAHLVKWVSKIDEIKISHVAHSREGFATGALAAAEWLIGKKGYFGMKDMLGF